MSKNIVILGAGYAGIEAAKKLNKFLKKDPECTITLIDNNPYHTLLTELHEVAGNRIDSSDVKVSLTEIFESTRVNVVVDYISDIDFDNQLLISKDFNYNYDYLILGTGSKASNCGVEGVKENCFTLWSLEDAENINQHIRDCFQKASLSDDPEIKRELLTFTVAGGGFTGIEMMGELIEWLDDLCYKYEISREEVDLYLIEGLKEILPNINSKLAERSKKFLEDKGVNVILGSFIDRVNSDSIVLQNGKEILTRTVLWNCGVNASDTAASLNLQADKAGRIKVNEYLHTIDYPEVYAVGDNASAAWTDKEILPALVEAALQTGETAAKNIAADIKGEEKEKFEANYHGIMVSIGSSFAVADVMGKSLKGFPAMFMKHMINMHYLFGLGGIKNGFSYVWTYLKEQSKGESDTAQLFGHISSSGYSFLFAFLRIFLGVQWFLAGLSKVRDGWLSYGDKLVSGATTSPIGPNPVGWYVSFIEAFVFEYPLLFQNMITIGELALGLMLILGIFVPLGALGSVFMSVNFFLSGFYPENPTLPWYLFASIACIGAGQSLSVDYYLFPWLKKTLWGKKKNKNQDFEKLVNSNKVKIDQN
ncbi:FAD-dependent oxidoreductase [Natronospora cellulosivora (SeqCode)]